MIERRKRRKDEDRTHAKVITVGEWMNMERQSENEAHKTLNQDHRATKGVREAGKGDYRRFQLQSE